MSLVFNDGELAQNGADPRRTTGELGGCPTLPMRLFCRSLFDVWSDDTVWLAASDSLGCSPLASL